MPHADFAEVIATEDVGNAMRRLGQPIDDNDEVLQMTIQTVDPDGTGKIGACPCPERPLAQPAPLSSLVLSRP